MNLLLAAFILVAVAVSIGLYLVFLGFRQRKRSPGLGLAHAGLALSGFILLSMAAYAGTTDKLNNVAVMFLFFALVGGGIVFALHEEKKPPSMGAVTAHAIMGLVALSLMIISFL